jgi:hypothetical protein
MGRSLRRRDGRCRREAEPHREEAGLLGPFCLYGPRSAGGLKLDSSACQGDRAGRGEATMLGIHRYFMPAMRPPSTAHRQNPFMLLT